MSACIVLSFVGSSEVRKNVNLQNRRMGTDWYFRARAMRCRDFDSDHNTPTRSGSWPILREDCQLKIVLLRNPGFGDHGVNQDGLIVETFTAMLWPEGITNTSSGSQRVLVASHIVP
jgi:hypothetical protein